MDNLIKEKNRLLRNIVSFTEVPLIILALIWLILLIVDLFNKTTPFLNTISISIWIIFILDFLLKFWLASKKVSFLRKNILTLISLIIPALRVLRIFRFIKLLRIMRGIRLMRVLGGINRGMNSLALVLQRRKIGYVIALTIIIIVVGAAGLFAFEKEVNKSFVSFGDSLWISSMIVASIGTEWPITIEGRILCFILALYGLAIFGYITATLATFFIGRDAENASAEIAGSNQIKELKNEIVLLSEEIKKLIKK